MSVLKKNTLVLKVKIGDHADLNNARLLKKRNYRKKYEVTQKVILKILVIKVS